MDVIKYYRDRISELSGEQRKLFPFAFGLIDSPSDQAQADAFYSYWEAEKNIQSCRNALVELNKGNK
ncbi:hypothetical protein [Herbiconiux daphne]|uniref:Uncharacterized protein n=1 Tax=Herbiconiux daphne TaxID=2970914 RepID=A0ABT2HBG3_9MICO|nr:hypothetical protein [Herbiconiux daphne]MCS5737279.1 hypothetical protein [Herbiconiux daphne]